MKFRNFFLLGFYALSIAACNNSTTNEQQASDTTAADIKEENTSYQGDNINMSGYVAYDANKKGTMPAVLVVHEWWGLNEYPKMRARELAKLGYFAMAVDMYGDNKIADNPDSAGKYAMPFYSDPQMAKRRFDAALAKLKTYSQVDTSKIAAIGYCFGGTQVLNMAKLGDNLKAVVSFHGGLAGVPADKSLLKADILVCHEPQIVLFQRNRLISSGNNSTQLELTIHLSHTRMPHMHSPIRKQPRWDKSSNSLSPIMQPRIRHRGLI